MTAFVPGLELSRDFYHEFVRSILDANFPGLLYSAALLGRGSEVLGFDDEMSTDHDWKPRVLLFLGEEDHARLGKDVGDTLRRELPPSFRDRPVDCQIHTVRRYFRHQLGIDVDSELEARDWLTLPEHGLRMFTAGKVYHDDVGLQPVRDRLAYYPRDVWLYLLMAGWWRLHPEVNLVGRAGSVGDELGSALIGSRLVSDLMRLCFLMERQYAPYSKWFGTAFSRLECGPDLSETLWTVLRAQTWSERENALLAAYETLAAMHNALGITIPVSIEVEQLWNRPFKVAWGDFPGLLRAQIQDPAVLSIAERWPIGPVDQLRDLLWPSANRHILLRLFEEV
jgi:Domain of unknown function (DUF4037)